MFMKNFFKWKDLFDFSNYSKDSRFFNETNKKVIGKMKFYQFYRFHKYKKAQEEYKAPKSTKKL